MGKYHLSKEESGDFLYQQVHGVTTTQELHNSIGNFVRVAGEYLGTEGPLSWAMATFPQKIYRFERQYNKDFSRNTFFGKYIVDRIHKKVWVFLNSCNMAFLDGVETGALLEFGKLQQSVERGERITSTLVWVEFLEVKDNGRSKSESGDGLGQAHNKA